MADKLQSAREYILRRIDAGEFRGGEKLPSARELAERTGISFPIVQMAFNTLIADGILSSGVSRQGTCIRKDWAERILPGSFLSFRPVWNELFSQKIRPQIPELLAVDHFQAGACEIRVTYDAVSLQKEYLDLSEFLEEEYPDRRIIVVDSLSASLGQGLLVWLAQQKKELGQTLEDVADWAEKNKLKMVHLFTVDDLNHLYRGGRVSRTTAIVGSMLNIKPVLHVDNEGKLTAIGKVRGRKKALQELVKLMDEKIGSFGADCDTIFISHGDCEQDAQYVAAKVKEKYNIKNIIINQVGATIGAHSGPGTMALFFVGDVR